MSSSAGFHRAASPRNTGSDEPAMAVSRACSRAHEISAQGKTAIAGSSDPVFRGDTARWNLAELLIAALSACHQLWYLHLCADAGIVVVAYSRGQRARSK